MRDNIPLVAIDDFLPDHEMLSVTEVAMAMLQAMNVNRLTEAQAHCPYCSGLLYAGRIGNARRLQVECDSCRQGITESFRSAMRPVIIHS